MFSGVPHWDCVVDAVRVGLLTTFPGVMGGTGRDRLTHGRRERGLISQPTLPCLFNMLNEVIRWAAVSLMWQL